MDRVQIRFFFDPETDEPHILNHGVTEDEAAFRDEGHTVMEVPPELVPAIRELIAKHQQQKNHETR